ncbi:MAG: DUF1761 domain-containing protein [Bacteroidetes bacterium]|nr:DUF1761 domain-containing protein [Bacteroidota bacterium]
MSIQVALQNINWLAVLVATLSTMLIGFLYYSPWSFGNVWMKAAGFTEEDLKGTSPMIYVKTLLLSGLTAVALALFIQADPSLYQGIKIGVIAGACFGCTATVTNALFDRKSLVYFMIISGHIMLNFIAIGAILGAWPK